MNSAFTILGLLFLCRAAGQSDLDQINLTQIILQSTVGLGCLLYGLRNVLKGENNGNL